MSNPAYPHPDFLLTVQSHLEVRAPFFAVNPANPVRSQLLMARRSSADALTRGYVVHLHDVHNLSLDVGQAQGAGWCEGFGGLGLHRPGRSADAHLRPTATFRSDTAFIPHTTRKSTPHSFPLNTNLMNESELANRRECSWLAPDGSLSVLRRDVPMGRCCRDWFWAFPPGPWGQGAGAVEARPRPRQRASRLRLCSPSPPHRGLPSASWRPVGGEDEVFNATDGEE